MPLTAGEMRGPYRILGQVGQGGMGVVYKAIDTRLNRLVALKFLTARGGDRFEREAKAISALNHPHIATLYDVGSQDGQPYLVMEFVEGSSLKGPMPSRDAIQAAIQIADAVAAAHSAGIIHRDLKPSNILLSPAGSVKILDFGLAKLTEPVSGPLDKTLTLGNETAEGTVVGTVAYMSPEQAEGKRVDARSDIFSFGAVLYELLTGRRAFEGDTAISTISAILQLDPKPIEGVPPELEKIIRRCLRKDPGLRLQHMSDVSLLLREVELESSVVAPTHPRSARLHPLFLATAAALLLAAVAVTYYLARSGSSQRDTVRKFDLKIGADVIHRGDSAFQPALSPNGAKLAYRRDGMLWIRDLAQLEPRKIPGTDQAIGPFWSPDSRFVGFQTGRYLKRADTQSGAVTTIGELPPSDADTVAAAFPFLGGSWSDTDSILVAIMGQGLYEVPAQGGTFKLVLAPDRSRGEYDLHCPHHLPGGRAFLYVVHPNASFHFSVWVRDGSSSRRLTEASEGSSGVAVFDLRGYLLYERVRSGKSVLAAPFSLSQLARTAPPFVVAENGAGPSVANDGTLLYVSGGSSHSSEIVLLDRAGRILQSVAQQYNQIRHPAFSPDGARIAFSAMEEGNWNVRVFDLTRATSVRITDAPEMEYDVAWSPSGNSLAFVAGTQTTSNRILARRSDGSGDVQTLVSAGEDLRLASPSWTAVGSNLVYVARAPKEPSRIWMLPPAGAAPARILRGSTSSMRSPSLAPGGGFVAYVSDESGRNEVYVRPFPAGEGRWLVSPNGGDSPRWSPRGDELFYLEGNTLMATSVKTKPAFQAAAPARLLNGNEIGVMFYLWFPDSRAYDISPDAQRFLAVRPSGGATTDSVILVENWIREFKR